MSLLVIMGSGETSPTMVSVHRRLAGTLPSRPSAVLLETPYGFQENVADISAKACAYFARSVGLSVTVAPGLRGPGVAAETDQGLAAVRAADWLFSGPGSPTYAMDCWRSTPVGQALQDRLARGRRPNFNEVGPSRPDRPNFDEVGPSRQRPNFNEVGPSRPDRPNFDEVGPSRQRPNIKEVGPVTVLASAAAATMGRWAVPVYEIYKVGATPYWAQGLDLMAHLDLSVAVIPHYDNTEGGTHDTRFCYLGERRLRILERELPAQAAVLGIDEHTAALIDPPNDSVEIVGRGGVTVRRAGADVVLPSGTVLSLTRLRSLVRGEVRGGAPKVEQREELEQPPTVSEVAADCEREFDEALARQDAAGLGQAVLDLESAVRAWSADTEEDDGADQAAAVLRTLIVRLAQVAELDPAERLAPLVDPLIAWRARLRAAGDFAGADEVRSLLAEAGVLLRDTPGDTRWTLPAAR
ncbi:cysteinyl-tRNA synthetase [Actinoplanes friuliensis]|uniref:Cysteinyl-tRNA synthetase n=1 Tax=Actinoplanes friuliensis DSM 7358 TaxID=1246995 RepID=U5WAW2_9ACTN|nr:cysteinyl-tRNA synthetase [Actinoplanes friuliensis]AGZ45110.1 cysteinyl-tRNA synthetase [Actinoplanes friuliensis DSM 7358]